MICSCSAAILAARQPSSAFGSPETLVDRGVFGAAELTAAFAASLARAVEGKTKGPAIKAALDRAGKRFQVKRVAEVVGDELGHGLMLGALDADNEAETGLRTPVARFAATDKGFARREFTEAIEAFERREVVTPEVFAQMTKAAQRRSFTIAGAIGEDMVKVAKRELIRAIRQGSDLGDFRERVEPSLTAAGWVPANPSHLETIFRTNVLNAYNSGRAKQMTQPAVLEARPFWQIVTVNDGPPRQRRTHQNAHLVVLAADDEFWLTAYPPFGFNCRCRVRSLSRRQGAHLVVSGSTIRDLPDPGFASGIGHLLAA